MFGTWWESANRVADEEAKRRAEKWMNEIRGQRLAEHSGLARSVQDLGRGDSQGDSRSVR